MKKWKRKKTELVLNEKYFKVRKDRVELPDGEELDWLYWDKSGSDSALVIGVTDGKKVVMNKRYRYLVGRTVMELPAGYGEKGESPAEVACREFEEETGYKCEKLVKLGSFWETYGQLKHKIHVFFTKARRKASQHLDITEDIGVKLVDFEEAVDMAGQNKIPDVTSTLAILLLKEKVERGEIEI